MRLHAAVEAEFECIRGGGTVDFQDYFDVFRYFYVLEPHPFAFYHLEPVRPEFPRRRRFRYPSVCESEFGKRRNRYARTREIFTAYKHPAAFLARRLVQRVGAERQQEKTDYAQGCYGYLVTLGEKHGFLEGSRTLGCGRIPVDECVKFIAQFLDR
ncbi:hypothetical protein SDC9_194546 [bioreactor metagenome]|uniref:Uncharacterized protein n=1 Tax=bioreactor metagenome TaxID=1076179 RepID=A0A645I6I8_9ZZZZ